MITDDYEVYEDFKFVQGLIFNSNVSREYGNAFIELGDLMHLKYI